VLLELSEALLRQTLCMHRSILLFIALLIGCNSRADVQAAGPAARAPQGIEAIEMRFSIYLARVDHRITVSPTGWLRSVRTDNVSYGANDIDPRQQRTAAREGQLTPDQIADLSRLFEGWEIRTPTVPEARPDGGQVTIRYGTQSASGSADPASPLSLIATHLMQLAPSMPASGSLGD
jgi:hypothetical protein